MSSHTAHSVDLGVRFDTHLECPADIPAVRWQRQAPYRHGNAGRLRKSR
jgi:hypothetical protein